MGKEERESERRRLLFDENYKKHFWLNDDQIKLNNNFKMLSSTASCVNFERHVIW